MTNKITICAHVENIAAWWRRQPLKENKVRKSANHKFPYTPVKDRYASSKSALQHSNGRIDKSSNAADVRVPTSPKAGNNSL